MPGSETITLDPTAVSTNRTALEITKYVALDGVDWGNATIEQYLAERGGYGGAIPIDYRVPNRTVTMPLRLQPRGTETFAGIRNKLQSKAALLQAEGGWLGRVTSNGGTVFADVTNASLKFGGGWGQAHARYDEDAELTLECLPDWYGAELTLSTHDGTTLPELTWTETGIKGNYPGRVRLVVTDLQGTDQLGLIWGFRSKNYSSASTAALAYEAEALTPMDTAAIASLSGASGGGSNTMQHSNLGANWTPVLNTNLLAGTYLTHVGSYRVWARVYSTSAYDVATGIQPVQLRFVWDVGDMTNPTENAAWRFPNASQFYMADLGEIRLDTTTGTHRWQGQIQAKGDVGGESVRIDRLFFQPIGESSGRLIAPVNSTQGLATYSARDEFNQTAGNLTGKTAAVGGTWAGAGDADDFTVEATGHTAQRAPGSADADFNTGRHAVSGVSAFAAQAVQVDAKYTGSPGGSTLQGVIARYTDASNWLQLTAQPGASTGTTGLLVRKRVAGTVTNLAYTTISDPGASAWFTLRLAVDASGNWVASYWRGSAPGDPILEGRDTALATGGALASGKPGFYDASITTAVTRNYDNFAAWVPTGDAVAFASQPVEIATEGIRRKDSSGTAYGPVSQVIGDLPRIPVSGVEARTVEGFVKASRGNLDDLPDSAIDDIRAQVFMRPAWLYLPDDTGS